MSAKRTTSAGAFALRGFFSFYVACFVLLPLLALVRQTFPGGASPFWSALTSPLALHSLWLTLWTSFVVAVCNAVFGTIIAWVLVRYEFPGRRWFSLLVDVPFAIPTLVAGVLLTVVFGPQTLLGQRFEQHGLRVLFAPPAIVLVLLFVTLPFVVRAVEPVLLELDRSEEEAAMLLGAKGFTVFYRVVLPPLLPAILSGALRSFARSLAEFGSVVVVSGNLAHRTLTAPVFVFGEVEGGRTSVAAAMSLVLLLVALVPLSIVRWLSQPRGHHRART